MNIVYKKLKRLVIDGDYSNTKIEKLELSEFKKEAGFKGERISKKVYEAAKKRIKKERQVKQQQAIADKVLGKIKTILPKAEMDFNPLTKEVYIYFEGKNIEGKL